MQIGGKTKQRKPSKPQVVVRKANGMNEFLLMTYNEWKELEISWIGDPNAATKFDSKYSAKDKIKHIENIPDSRCFMMVER